MPTKTQKKKSDVICVSQPIRIAVMIDGGFFIKRYNALYNTSKNHDPETVANSLYSLSLMHVGNENYLYRIFY